MTPGAVQFATLAGVAVMLWLAPTLSRPGVYFSVTVRPEFRQTDIARASLQWYRSVLVVASVVSLALTSIVATGVAVLLLASAGTIAWIVARQRILPYAAPASVVRRASLTPRAGTVPGGALVLAGPFVIVVLGAAIVAANWEAIPAEFPSMRRGSNGMVTKSVATVFQPFAFTGALLIAFTIQSVFLVRRTRHIAAGGPALEAEARFKHRTVLQSVAASYLMAVGPTWFAIRRVLGQGDAGASTAVWLGLIAVLSVGVTIWTLRVGQGGQRQVPPAEAGAGDATPDAAWLGGLVYFNPGDPAVFVEKRMGVGWSLNLGSVWAWVFLACAFALPMLVLRLMR